MKQVIYEKNNVALLLIDRVFHTVSMSKNKETKNNASTILSDRQLTFSIRAIAGVAAKETAASRLQLMSASR